MVEIIGDLTRFEFKFEEGATIEDLVSDETINPQSHNLSAFIHVPSDYEAGIHPSFPLSKLKGDIFLLPYMTITCIGEDDNIKEKEIPFERWMTVASILFDHGEKKKIFQFTTHCVFRFRRCKSEKRERGRSISESRSIIVGYEFARQGSHFI